MRPAATAHDRLARAAARAARRLAAWAPDADDTHVYMNGACHHLARALHRVTGLPLWAALEQRGRGRRATILHIFVGALGREEDPRTGLAVDIHGVRPVSALLAELAADGEDGGSGAGAVPAAAVVRPTSEAEIARWTAQLRLARPNRATEADAARLARRIARAWRLAPRA